MDLGVLASISQVSRDFVLLHDIRSLTSLGSSVYVIGSFLDTGNMPSWTCFIDGFALISNNISQADIPKNNVEMCSLQNIVVKTTPSNLTVVVADDTFVASFVFDYIKYVPISGAILDNATVIVEAFDTQIQYSSGWNKVGTIGMETSVQGASMTFDFVVALCL
jgi:hypothetical protein